MRQALDAFLQQNLKLGATESYQAMLCGDIKSDQDMFDEAEEASEGRLLTVCIWGCDVKLVCR